MLIPCEQPHLACELPTTSTGVLCVVHPLAVSSGAGLLVLQSLLRRTSQNTPESLMKVFLANPSVFPFAIEGRSSFVDGQKCTLVNAAPTGIFGDASGTVRVNTTPASVLFTLICGCTRLGHASRKFASAPRCAEVNELPERLTFFMTVLGPVKARWFGTGALAGLATAFILSVCGSAVAAQRDVSVISILFGTLIGFLATFIPGILGGIFVAAGCIAGQRVMRAAGSSTNQIGLVSSLSGAVCALCSFYLFWALPFSVPYPFATAVISGIFVGCASLLMTGNMTLGRKK
jgi:hypothetical protein